MCNQPVTNGRSRQDREVIDEFLGSPSEQSFERLFHAFTPQLVAFFRSRRCDLSLAEDLAQEVMIVVYRKAGQLRDRRSFRGWLFRIAVNVLCVHYSAKKAHQAEIVALETITDHVNTHQPGGAPAFEFLRWMQFLDSREREVMKLRFIEDWEYHEIAAAHDVPIGTVQWRVFNAKKKLASHLIARNEGMRMAA